MAMRLNWLVRPLGCWNCKYYKYKHENLILRCTCKKTGQKIMPAEECPHMIPDLGKDYELRKWR